MPTTKEIKRRIKGISSTRQITKAMEMVSTAKLQKARTQLERTRPYYQTVLENIRDVLTHVSLNHPLIQKRPVKKTLLIVVTADRGLAGGYNHNVIALAEALVKENPEAYKVMVIGDKARESMAATGAEIIKSYRGIPEVIAFELARPMADVVVDHFQQRLVDEVKVVFTRFDTTLQYTPMVETLLPFHQPQEKTLEPGSVITFEPSADEVLDYLIPQFITVNMYGVLVEASASEQASRRAAMEAATDNADEMLEELELTYNRARQAAITSEITEIISGANAQQ